MVNPTDDEFLDAVHIGPENIESGTGRIINTATSRELGLISSKYTFDNAALIYSKIRPNLNKVCMPAFAGICSADAYPIWPDGETVSKEFLFYFMTSPAFLRQSIRVSMRTGLPKINRRDLGAIQVPVPPLPQQQRIADILSAWDRAIELNEKLIAAKQQRKQSLIHRLITQPLLATRHTSTIQGWVETRVGELIEKRTEKSSDLESFPLHSFTIEDGVTAKTDRYERSFLLRDSENNEYAVVHFGDFVINPMNLRFGAIARSRVKPSVCVSAYYDVFQVVSSDCDASFLEHVFKSPLLIHIYDTVATGSLIEKRRVHFSEFVKISIALPTKTEQKRRASIIEAQDHEIRLLLERIDLLKKQKRGLMQQLLTGKVRVDVETEAAKG